MRRQKRSGRLPRKPVWTSSSFMAMKLRSSVSRPPRTGSRVGVRCGCVDRAIARIARKFERAEALLVDSFSEGFGGSGQRFN